MFPVACLARGLQCTLSRLMAATTTPTPIVGFDPRHFLLSGQLLEISTAVQKVVVIVTVWTVSLPSFHLTVAAG